MKTVLFLPGSEEGLYSRNYIAVLKAIESQGYETTFVPIGWKRTTMDNWVAELMNVYEKYDPDETVLAGFSWGAMITLAAAATRSPAELWLFSLSPYFAEDISRLPKSWLTKIGHRRVSAFRSTSFNRLSAGIECPVKLFAGEKELAKWSATKRRFDDATKRFKRCTATIIPGAAHEVEHPAYLTAIKENI